MRALVNETILCCASSPLKFIIDFHIIDVCSVIDEELTGEIRRKRGVAALILKI